MFNCLVVYVHQDAGNMKDTLGRHPFARVPEIGEEVRFAETIYQILRVIHTPQDAYVAELHVRRS